MMESSRAQPSTPVRAALYARVSTERQAGDDKNSLPVQRARFMEWCAVTGADPVGEYEDQESGRRVTRTGYQRLLAAARAGECDVIVVRHLDRFGRNDWEVMARLGELRALGVEVVATDEDIGDFIRVALSAWKSAEESKRLGERVRSALVRQASLGRQSGRAPYGYRAERGQLVVDPAAAAVVRRIFSMLLDDNLGPRAIAVRLNREGVPSSTGGRWSARAVRLVLRRPAYVGDIAYAGTVARDAHEPVIPRETWERAQERLDSMRGLPGGRTQSSPYLLSGLARCGYCGGPMWGMVTRQGKRRYQCGNKFRLDSCDHWNRQSQEELERAVLDTIVEGPATEGEPDTARVEEAGREVARCEREVERLDDELRRNLDLYRAEALTLDQLRIANRQLHDAREAALSALEAARVSLERAERSLRRQLDGPTRAALRERIESLPTPQAKALLQSVLERVTVYADRVEVRIA